MNTFAQIRQVSIMLGDGWRFTDRKLPGEKVYLWRGHEKIAVNATGQVRGMQPYGGDEAIRKMQKRNKPYPNAKLSIADVREIRSRRGTKQASLAAEFGVNDDTISYLLSGRTWANVA